MVEARSHPDEPVALEVLAAVKRLEPRFFRGGRFNPRQAVGLVVESALICGAPDVSVRRVDDWFVILSGFDWLVEDGRDLSDEAFERICSYRAGGDNSMRPEVLLTAFAPEVVTVGPEGLRVVLGSASSLPNLPESIPGVGRLVAFRARRAIRARIRFLTLAEGGRMNWAQDGIRPQLMVEHLSTSCTVRSVECRGSFEPGIDHLVDLELMFWEQYAEVLDLEDPVVLLEGSRVIATGRVLVAPDRSGIGP